MRFASQAHQTSRPSPLVHDGKVFHGRGMRLCLDLSQERSCVPPQTRYILPSSDQWAILSYEINGSFLQLLDAQPDRLNEGQKFKMAPSNAPLPVCWVSPDHPAPKGLSCLPYADLPLNNTQDY